MAAGPAAKGIEEYQKEWDATPLLMNKLPEDAQDNIPLQALQSLMHEDGPEATAESLRLQANEYFRGRKFREALSFYTQAIDEMGPKLSADTKRVLYVNRAACNLELKNYGKVLSDGEHFLRLSDQPPEDAVKFETLRNKAVHRMARAALGVGDLDGAEEFLKMLRSWGQPDQKVEAEVTKAQGSAKDRAARRAEDARVAVEIDAGMKRDLLQRGLVLPKKWSYAAAIQTCPPDVISPCYAEAVVDPSERPTRGTVSGLLCFAVFLLRPLASPPTRDLVLNWVENVTLAAQLDEAQIDASHQIYVNTHQGRLLKIGRKLPLLEVMKAAAEPAEQDGLPLRDGWCLELYVVPKEGAPAWVEEMKRSLKR